MDRFMFCHMTARVRGYMVMGITVIRTGRMYVGMGSIGKRMTERPAGKDERHRKDGFQKDRHGGTSLHHYRPIGSVRPL